MPIRQLGCNSDDPFYDSKRSKICTHLEAWLDGKCLNDVAWYDLDRGCYGQLYRSEDGYRVLTRKVDRFLDIRLTEDAPDWAREMWDAP
jgi:hypothetical protein